MISQINLSDSQDRPRVSLPSNPLSNVTYRQVAVHSSL